MKRIAALSLALFIAAPAMADHTPDTRGEKAYIEGLPNFCCSVRDCEETPVRLVHWNGNYPVVEALGREWIVLGQTGTGKDGLYVAPKDKTYLCIERWQRERPQGTARCAMVKPEGVM